MAFKGTPTMLSINCKCGNVGGHGIHCAMSENTNVTRQSLNNQTMDYVSFAAKAVLGAVPFAGSLLVELACTIIPNQRVDRLAKFAMELERRLNSFDQEQVRTKLTDENFTDLAEEAMRQAARSVTDER